MRKIKRGLALLLTALMLVTALPWTAMAAEQEEDPKAWDGIAYCIGTEQTDEMGTIGWPGYAEEGFTFEEDGSYTIHLPEGEDSVFFIYYDENMDPVEEVVTFSEDKLSVNINGHTIYAVLNSGEAVELGSTVEALTLFPVEEKRSSEDLRGKFPEELKEVKVADLLPSGVSIPADQEIAYGVIGNDAYEIKKLSDAVLDFSDMCDDGYWDYYNDSYVREYYNIRELIVLSTDDPTDKSTVRYIVTVELPTMYNLLEINAQNSSGTIVGSAGASQYEPGWDSEPGRYSVSISNRNNWKPEDGAVLWMNFNSQFGNTSGVTTTVYEGSYTTSAEITAANAKDITSQIWGSSATGYNVDMEEYRVTKEFTLVVTRGGEEVMVKPVNVYVHANSNYLRVYFDNLLKSSGGNSVMYRTPEQTGSMYNRTYTIMLKENEKVNDTYYAVMYGYGYKDGESLYRDDALQMIDGAYVGNYATKDAAVAAGAEDIKDSLFGGGYAADYSKGVSFSIFTIATDDLESQRFYHTIQTRPYVAPVGGVVDRDNRSLDTYFYVTNADKEELGYSAYYMSGDDDSYYANGYQTVFVLKDGGPVTAEKIHPVFQTGTNVTAYAEHNQNGNSGGKQESGVTEHDFKPGESIHYSAASERKTHLKNYWITFVTQTQNGPDLFINGITNADDAHKDKNGVPIREVLLGAGSSDYHDIFVANIGNKEMTGLTVELTNEKNVKLDDYWDFGETKTLDAFTSTERTTTYGELFNVTKIRLVRDGSGTGEISGTLTISANGIEPVTIKLSGKAGLPQITTETLEEAVKYVPYSQLIQTSNMRSSSGIVFTATRPLPSGLTLEPDGEIYGAPLVTGEFRIGVRMTYNGQDCGTKEFTLNIKDNTDVNVWYASDANYQILNRIGLTEEESADIGAAPVPGNGTDGSTTGDQEYDANQTYTVEAGTLDTYQLRSAGEYYYFTKVWLDGVELREDQYESSEGSTRITITDKSVDGARVNGTHTIAAEFREKDSTSDKGTLKRTAQNYVIKDGVDAPSRPSTPSTSGGSSSSDRDKPSREKPDREKPSTTTPTVPETPAAPVFPFGDILPGTWYYDDVFWAWEQNLMNGVMDNRFAPEANVDQATIVTILARIRNIDLTSFAGETSETVEPGKWYTESAIWAQRAGLLPDNSSFTGQDPLTRDGMAIMLVNYMTSMGLDTNVSDEMSFADAEQMSEAGQQAFQVLYHYGIFKGVGDNRMDPAGSTTRAQFAALIHRVSNFAEGR